MKKKEKRFEWSYVFAMAFTVLQMMSLSHKVMINWGITRTDDCIHLNQFNPFIPLCDIIKL